MGDACDHEAESMVEPIVGEGGAAIRGVNVKIVAGRDWRVRI